MDFLGIFLALAGMTVVILGLTWGGREHPWDSAHVIATLVVGTVVSISFVLWQWKGPRYPLVPRTSPLVQARPATDRVSPHLQIQDSQRRMLDHGDQRMEFCHAGLLRTVLLPAGLRLLSYEVRGNAFAHHHCPDTE